MTNVKEYIKDLLFRNRIEDALRYLKDWSFETQNNEIENSIILLSAQYERYKTEKLLTLSTPETELNKIIYGISTIVNSISNIDALKVTLPSNIDAKNLEDKENPVLDWLSHKPISFLDWFTSSNIGWIIGAISLLGFTLSFLSIGIGFAGRHGSASESFAFEEQFIKASSGIHFFIALLIVIVFYLRRNSSDVFMKKVNTWIEEQTKEKNRDYLISNNLLFNNIVRAENATKDFMTFWNLTWVAWLFLYVYFYCKKEGIVTYEPGLDIISSISSLTIITCFSILFYRIKGTSRHYLNPISIFSLIPIVVFIVLEIITPVGNPEIKLILQILFGLFSGLSIALLVGRLTSIYIETPIILIVFLYIYSIIQSLLSFFEFSILDFYGKDELGYIDHCLGTANFIGFQSIIKSFVMNFALGAKCLLSLIILWLYEKGGLYLYCIRVNTALNNIESNENAIY